MAFDDGTQNLIKNVDETLKLLHGTIQKQTKATDKQSRVMIWLTAMLLIFTIVLVAIGFIQIKIYEKNMDTNSNVNQTQADYKQPPSTIGTQPLPNKVKVVTEGKHK